MPTSQEVRDRLDHPVIDGDGHYIELPPVFADFVGDHAGGAFAERSLSFAGWPWPLPKATAEERRRYGLPANAFWNGPGNADYWTMVTTPGRYYEKLEEAGIDFAVLYPSRSVTLPAIDDDDFRLPLCKLFNQYLVEEYGRFADRFAPAAVVPMHTPTEAIEALEHAVGLGFKVAMIPTYVARPLGGANGEYSRWIDTYGLDSLHDYDPVWRRAIQLRVPLSCHSPGMGFTDRSSPTNYMYNHIGHFAAAGEALAKSLFFGGVTNRFPELRIGLLEGGVVTGVRLFADLVGRWEKRGPHVIERLNPANVDLAAVDELVARYGGRIAKFRAAELVGGAGLDPESRRGELPHDDFSLTGVESVEDIRDQYCRTFFWGCEADDALAGIAFDRRFTPLGARVPAFMGSDLGHWDVPDPSSPLAEAYELVERGLLDENDLRAYVFENPVRYYGGLNPSFFVGTVLERDVAATLPGKW